MRATNPLRLRLDWMFGFGLMIAASMGAAEVAPVHLANPLQGTDSSWSFSHGNTYPAIALPFPNYPCAVGAGDRPAAPVSAVFVQ